MERLIKGGIFWPVLMCVLDMVSPITMLQIVRVVVVVDLKANLLKVDKLNNGVANAQTSSMHSIKFKMWRRLPMFL